MDKIKKYLGFLVFPLLFLMMLFPVGEAHAATDITSKVKIDNLKITIASTGSETEGIHGSNDTLMKLKYSGKFSFPNVAANEIKDGDYFIVKAPNNLSLTDGSLDLIDSTSNIKMGTVQVDNANHRLVFTFNDKVKDKQNIRGDFVAEATETLQKEGKTVTYVLPDGKKQTITYKVNKYQQTDVIGETITKYGYNDNNKAIAHFQMKINRAKKDMTGHVVKITDDVSKGAFANYVEGTFYMYEAEFETTNTNSSALKHLGDKYEITTDSEVYKADSDKKALLTFVNGKRGFELLMPTNMGTKSFFLTYDTSSPADTSMISNSAQYLIDNQPQLIWEQYGGSIGTRTEATFNLKTVKSVGASVTADIAGKIKITKYDEADATVKLAGVVFEIREKTTNNLVDTVTTDADGIAVSKALNDGKYIVKEKTPKSGYLAISKEFEVELKAGKGVPLNISNKRETVDFEATKTWLGGKSTDYKKVKLGLYVHKKGQTVADSKPVSGNYTPEVTESNGVYTYKWKNQLPKYDVDGTTELVYSVRELEDQTNLPLAETETVAGETSDYVVSYNEDKTKITNTYKPAKISVTAKKVWSGGKETVRPTVYFKLYRTPEGGAIEEVAGAAQKEVPKTAGTVEWTDLPATDEHGVKYTYSVMEVDDEGNLVTAVDGYTANQTADLTVTNTYGTSPTKADIEVKKELVGGRPTPLQNEEFEFILKDKNGQEVQRAKNDAAGRVVFKDIPFDKAGTYTYTIKEVKGGTTEKGIIYDSKTVTAKVTVTDDGKGNLTAVVDYSSDASDGSVIFTNTYSTSKAKASLEVTKKLTGRELKADEFEFTLTDQDGNVKETVKNDKDGNVKFSELEFDKAGTYTYKIAEKAGTATGIQYDTKTITATVTVVDNGKGVLEATVAYDGEKVFENTYTPVGATSVTLGAKKVLEGKDLEAGKYSFVLKEGDKELETVTNAADGTVTFSPISYDESQVGTHKYTISEVVGSEAGITYDKTVQEVEVTVEKVSATELKATASKEAKDLVFTNKYTPAKTSVSVKKAWKDENNQDGKRPASVTVKLLADGQDTGKTLELNAANGWTGSFTDLDADKGGTPIQYTVVEVTVPGYTSKVAGDAASGFTITNSYSPETVDITATKNWDDANNQDGKRPTKITINLLADGQKVASKEVQAAADGTWTATFEKLAKYKAGKEIKYTVTEEAVAEYESTITDFTITNKYAPKEIDYKVTKVWNDANNQDGKRPKSVTVQLFKSVGGSKPVAVEGKKLTLTAKDKTDANTWVASFTNLPQYEAGKEIPYSIKEVDVPAGYEASVTGQVVTNTHNPDTVILSGTKVWKDNNNQDGKRTTSVKVQILKNDKEVAQEIEVSEATGWKFESKALPKYENGKLIEYKVKEVVVKGYTSTITTEKEGKYTITNEYTPEKIAVSGQKTWIDNNDQDRIRPASITVKLLANGKETGQEVTATAETGWKYEFTNLDRYQNGKPIEYTVKEVGVPTGYTATETGMNVTNTHIPEKTSVKGKKIWKGDENHTDARPPFITVKLLIDGKETDKVATASEATGWTYEFTGLDRYKDGQAIEYSVVEVPVKGYTSKVEDFNITNTYTPEKPTPGEPNEPGKPGQKPQLPNTGEKVSNAAVVAGLALMAVTGGLYFVSRKNK